MKLFPARHQPRAILFDIDNTLYRDDAYAVGQVDVLIERYAAHTAQDLSVAREQIAATRSEIRRRRGGYPSLGLTMAELGIPIRQSVAWREELIVPEDHLAPDPQVRDMLSELPAGMPVAAVTNNPVSIGRRSLKAMGLSDGIRTVVGLDTTWHSKPDWEPFAAACHALNCSAEYLLMVGDRVDVDLKPVVDRGGAGLLVESRADLLELPSLVRSGAFHTVDVDREFKA